MPRDADQIKELGLNQLSDLELQQAVAAFSGFEALFGDQWVDKFFGPSKSKRLVLFLCRLWEAWGSVSGLERSAEIAGRRRHDPTALGVMPEVLTISGLRGAGAQVSLFPEVNGRVPDTQFQCGEETVYVEVSRRSLTESMEVSQTALQRLSQAAAGAVPGRHGKVGISREISYEEMDAVITWLAERMDVEVTLGDLAVFHTSDLATGGGDPNDASTKFVPEPRMFSTI
jgi:hypothetical protein